MGFVSLGKQVPEVRFKLCRGGNGDDADAEVVDIQYRTYVHLSRGLGKNCKIKMILGLMPERGRFFKSFMI